MLFIQINLIAQDSDIPKEYTQMENRSVKKAILKSALIPGWGQWYNNQKVKALIVFGGEMALIGGAIVQNQRAVASESVQEREFYQYDRSKFIWWLVAAHLLNILDAYVDASLWGFDTGPDLSKKDNFQDNNVIRFCFCINLNN